MISVIVEVTTRTLGRANAGSQSREINGRLHPTGKSGVSFARNSGSAIFRSRYDRASSVCITVISASVWKVAFW